MLSNQEVNPARNGIYDYLSITRDLDTLSDASVNQVLQILYDDLKDANNIVHCNRSKRAHFHPDASIIIALVREYLQECGETCLDTTLLYVFNLISHRDYQACRLAVERMLTKHFFVLQLRKTKALLYHCLYMQEDQARRNLFDFIVRVKSKAKQQRTEAIRVAMSRMQKIGFFRYIDTESFFYALNRIATTCYDKNKTHLKISDESLRVKRCVENFELKSMIILKQRIEEILAEDTCINKQLELWEKLNALSLSDAIKYKKGTPVTLYYTGVGMSFEWYTAEECVQNKFPFVNPMTKEIPSEQAYIEAVNMLCDIYRTQQQVENSGWQVLE